MKIIQYITLIIFLWALPTFALLVMGDAVGSYMSYLSFILIIAYFFLSKKGRPAWSFIFLGISYFVISGLVNILDSSQYINDLLKYFVFIVGGIELVRNTTHKELFIILALGAVTVIIHALLFQEGFGRYGGIYLNPNGAGLICIVGYSLGYGIKIKTLKLIGQFIFTLAGILTLSRTFIALWLLVSIMSAILNKKEMVTLGLGALVLLVVISISSMLNLDAARFSALTDLLDNKVDKETITDDSRTGTWSQYTEVILDNVFVGSGYRALQGEDSDNVGIKVGVHNTYLMILGESGFIPLLIFLFINLRLLFKSIVKHHQNHPEYIFMSLAIIIFLLTSHNYFDNFVVLMISIWLYAKVHEEEEDIEEEPSEVIEHTPLNPI